MAYLHIENVNKRFGSTEVLKGIDFSIEKGEVISVLGSSGSGKTTLLRCINFLETPDTGKIILDGSTIFDSKLHKKDSEAVLAEKRLNFGLVFQSFNLFPQYNALENVTLAPTIRLFSEIENLKKVSKKAAKQKKEEIKKLKTHNFDNNFDQTAQNEEPAIKLRSYKSERKAAIEAEGKALLEKVGLADKMKNYPCELSGGQAQRVAIARALALKPKILCFDEPTSALDPELTGEVLKVIRSLKDEERTMIIVTHEMGFAKRVSDKIIFMADGVVEETGTPEQIFDAPKSEKLKAFLFNVSKDGE